MDPENRGRVLQNIVLAGGSCMFAGFKVRLLNELSHLIQTCDEFEDLRVHAERVAIPDCVFAPNVAAWVGASLMMSLG